MVNSPLLIKYSAVIMDGFNFLITKRYIKIYAYVIMPDHIHFIAEGKDLSKHTSSFKSFTARKIIDCLKAENNISELTALQKAKLAHKTDRDYQLWTEGFHPKQIFSDEVMKQKINYIHYNPVKAGLVSNELDWKFSSAEFYKNGNCELPLTFFGDMSTPTHCIEAS